MAVYPSVRCARGEHAQCRRCACSCHLTDGVPPTLAVARLLAREMTRRDSALIVRINHSSIPSAVAMTVIDTESSRAFDVELRRGRLRVEGADDSNELLEGAARNA